MKPILALACAGVCVLSLTACGTTGAHVLDNLSNDCERHYDGAVSAGLTGGGFTGTVKIDCHAKAPPAPAPPPAAP